MSRLDEARQILEDFGFDKKRRNDISGRTLMALAEVSDQIPWSQASSERMGVRAILDWMREHLEYPIAENSRETVRRFVLHHFIDAGFCLHNDDDPTRPTNSSKNNYRLQPDALKVIASYGTDEYEGLLNEYLEKAPGLAKKYARERALTRIPVTIPSGSKITLQAGGQNILIKSMIDNFCSYFAQGAEVLYVGDADSKLMIFNEEKFLQLGVQLDPHGKFPDLVVYHEEKNWLYLMEACSTHGPIDHIRYNELSEMFAASSAGLIFVSCFPDMATMRRYLPDLAWGTEAWVADNPTHMIHLNGDKFLGPRSYR